MSRLIWAAGALSGAASIGLGSYGAHGLSNASEYDTSIFKTANQYHMINSLALLASAYSRFPLLSGGLLAAGITLFSGTLYGRVIQKDHSLYGGMPPIGGSCLIAGWVLMALKRVPK